MALKTNLKSERFRKKQGTGTKMIAGKTGRTQENAL